MHAETGFPIPPSKRRRISQDSSKYSPRSPSPDRDIPLRGREHDRLGGNEAVAKEEVNGHLRGGRQLYRKSSSQNNSDSDRDDVYPHPNADGGHDNYRRRNLSRASDRSHSQHSRSRSVSRRPGARSPTLSQQDGDGDGDDDDGSFTSAKKLSFKPLYNLSRAHARGITSVKFSPDLSLLAVGSADASINIYSMTQPITPFSTNPRNNDTQHPNDPPVKLLRTLRAHLAGVNALAWSPVGPNYTLASASDDKSILLWSPLSSDFPISPSPLTGHSNYVYSLAFSPKGNMLVSGSYDEAVFLWDVRSARIMRSLPAHSDPVSGVDFLRDGSMVCSCAEDGLIRIWDSGTGQCLKTLVDEDRKPVTAVRFTPNGKFVVAWTLDGCIRLWRYTEGTCVKTYTGHVNKEYSLGGAIGEYMSGTEAFLVSGSEDGEVVAWDVTSKEILWRGKGHEDVVLAVDFGKLKDGRGILVSAGKDRDLRLWIEDVDPVGDYGRDGFGDQDTGMELMDMDMENGEEQVGGVEDEDEDEEEHVKGRFGRNRAGGTRDDFDPMVVDVNITRTSDGDVKIEETIA